MRNKIILTALLLAGGHAGMAQHVSDTTALIREFNDVMAFAVQPYVHYASTTTMQSSPSVNASDTGNVLRGDFYKYEDNLYYGNQQEEMFLQDSLMVRVNHHRKTIQVSKVDVASKKRMDLLPLKKVDQQKLLRDHYTIARMPDRGDTASIVIRSQEGRALPNLAGVEMMLVYTRQNHLPVQMQVTMRLRPQGTGQVKQTAAVDFGTIETTKQKAGEMPSWKDRIAYDPASNIFKGKGACDGYEVIKTF